MTSPITLAEAKAQVNVANADTTHDDVLTAHIATAAAHIEAMTGIVSAEREHVFRFDCLYNGLQLRLDPVQTVDSIEYLDTNDTSQALATTVYRVYSNDFGTQCIELKTGQSWPSLSSLAFPVTITTTVGHASNDDIDERVKTLAKLIVEALFDGTPLDAVPAINIFTQQLRKFFL